VREVHEIPKVSIQLWYGVGSRDEQDKERGIAHLIEHMIFKGTDTLSESDINVVTHMLSGSCNAFTSYDFTGYLFNFPTQHWQEALPIMADCMTNARFEEQMLSSEMKAVIQELKMYRDKYVRSLVDELIGAIFADHPYHHPIIGYKQDLWSVHSKNLHDFYKKHYIPNNAALVIVGDVNAQEVFDLAEQYFGSIPANPNYARPKHYLTKDIVSKSIVMYRDIKQPLAIFTFLIPGTDAKKEHLSNLLSWVLGKGKSSRLYKKLVDELHLATSLDASAEELFEHGLFYIIVEPSSVENIPVIESIIKEEIQSIAKHGISKDEIMLGIRQTQMSLYELLEDTESQAFEIGKYFFATGDENYIFNYLNYPTEQLLEQTHELAKKYLRASVMHKGLILPLPQEEKDQWHELQVESDKEDERILSARVRTTPVEEPSYACSVEIKEPDYFSFPKADEFSLKNNLKILYYNNTNTPKIDLILDFKADAHYDPLDKQGLCRLVSTMLLEGTKKHTSQELAHLLESRGISLSSYPGGISMSLPQEEFEFALSLLHEILTQPIFLQEELDKVKQQTLAHLKAFWDDPMKIAGQIIREQLYKDHPYSKNSIGTIESITHISRKDIIQFFSDYISPQGARLVIVGDLQNYKADLNTIIEKNLGSWHGPEVSPLAYPALSCAKPTEVNYVINRDQVVLALAQLSVDRKHNDFDKLLLFDQVFGGGVLGSMSSRLFDLREQSGLFYTISGSLIANADEQPGFFLVRTLVSMDRLQEAKDAISQTIDTAAASLTEDELQEAKHAILNSLVDYFASSYSMATAFLFIDKFGFSKDYFDNRAQALQKITIKDVQEAVHRLMDSKNLLTFCIGRVDEKPKNK
jgi:zinc protease